MTPHAAAIALSIALICPLQTQIRPVLGTPRILADQGGYTSSVFTADASAVICSRVNAEEIAEELWRIELASGERELIGYGRQPSVQGSMLAYVGTEPGTEGIWLTRLDTEEPPKAVTKSTSYEWPSISPDTKTVAAAHAHDRRDGIFLFHLDDGDNAWMTRGGESQPVYSADGSKMLVSRGKQIWLIKNVGPREEIIEEMVTRSGREHLDPSWGPGGAWIAFIGRWNERFSNVGVLHLPSGQLAWVTEGLTGARSPLISPAGDKLVYIGTLGDDNAIYVCDLRLP